MRTVVIAIYYRTIEVDTKSLRRGEFKLKGTREEVALQFWRYIKRESPLEVEFQKITCDGEDITELVKNR